MGSAGMKRRGRRKRSRGDGAASLGQRDWFGGGAYGAPPWGLGGRGEPSRYQWGPLGYFAAAIGVGLVLLLIGIAIAS